ncbi:hypothetical protein QFZ75_007738 [Streptomyces sp. V3I8]|uniref:hypothetical protein n=1 Tax=Streptomyces sp. V3I8 TaxID=3042279 RepID=UPI00277F991C|nr:hypothetical protein [Streptomyces sp. V3I8]MDQ1041322.1 hypothetical protein [Streptomyces sp. V3I8]
MTAYETKLRHIAKQIVQSVRAGHLPAAIRTTLQQQLERVASNVSVGPRGTSPVAPGANHEGVI